MASDVALGVADGDGDVPCANSTDESETNIRVENKILLIIDVYLLRVEAPSLARAEYDNAMGNFD